MLLTAILHIYTNYIFAGINLHCPIYYNSTVVRLGLQALTIVKSSEGQKKKEIFLCPVAYIV